MQKRTLHSALQFRSDLLAKMEEKDFDLLNQWVKDWQKYDIKRWFDDDYSIEDDI